MTMQSRKLQIGRFVKAIRLVYNPFSNLSPNQVKIYSQLQLSRRSEPIGIGVLIFT